MSSSGIAYPPPTYIPPLSIFNPVNFPVNTPTTGSSGGGSQSNIFPNGLSSGNVIQLDGGTGGAGGDGTERSINGISYLNFIDTANTTPVGAPVLTSISQTNNTFTIGGTNAIGVNITGSALTFNGTPVGTGSGNVSTASDNTYANGTSQNFFNASISQGLTFSTPLTGIVLNNSLVFQNNAGTDNILLSYATNAGNFSNWTLSSQNSNVNMIFSFPSASIDLSSSYINLNPTSGVLLNGVLQNTLGQTYSPNVILTGRGSYLFDSAGSPFIAYNIGGSMTTSPLVISSTLSNYAQLTGGTALLPQTFSGVNSFTGTITAPTQALGNNTTNVATTQFVQSAIPSLSNYATLTGGTALLPQTFSGVNSFTGTTTAPTQAYGDNTTNVATTAFVQSAINTYNKTSGSGVWNGSQTTWLFSFGTSTPNYGNTFRFVITTNTTPTPVALQTGLQPLSVNGSFGSMSGNGIIQPYTSSPIPTIFNAYALSNLNTLSIPFIISSNSVNLGTWQLVIAVNGTNISGYTLNMTISPTS
jgi:hypothetical protein